MGDMPKPRLPHLRHERTRHGARVWYVRIDDGPRIRIKAAFGTPEFTAEYHAAIAGTTPTKPGKPKGGTLSWLVERYKDSATWAALSPATRRQRENILAHVLASAGQEQFVDITRKVVSAGVDRRKNTPAAARHFIHTMRGLFAWAVNADLAEINPADGVKPPKYRTEGHHVWTDSEVVAFEERWPVGTRERLAFDVLMYTGFRRGDAVRLGRQHVRNGTIRIKTEKTGEIVVIPLLEPLAKSIAASPTGDLAFICGEKGRPMTKESFGNWFRDVCAKAGVPGSAHGIRKAAATRAANQGATVAQLEAIFGWRGGNMASHYTRNADRERLASDAADKMILRKK